MASQKIAVYSLSDLKNTTDDALPNYLTSLKFKQSHSLTDVRLALGYAAVLIAAITFYADYKLGWDKTKSATFWAVLVYFTLNGALTFWIWGVERGNVFKGEIEQSPAGPTLLSIASNVTKPVPVYNLIVSYENSKTGRETFKISSPFTRWFDVDGFFVAKPFQQWLASSVPPIGKVDPQSRPEPSGRPISEDSKPDSTAFNEQQTYSNTNKPSLSEQTPVTAKSRRGKKA